MRTSGSGLVSVVERARLSAGASCFDLRRTRQTTGRDQYVVLLAYEQGVSVPPIVITAHEGVGLTHLSASTAAHGDPLAQAVLAAFDEIWDCLSTD